MSSTVVSTAASTVASACASPVKRVKGIPQAGEVPTPLEGEDYILLKGGVIGPKKRIITLRKTLFEPLNDNAHLATEATAAAPDDELPTSPTRAGIAARSPTRAGFRETSEIGASSRGVFSDDVAESGAAQDGGFGEDDDDSAVWALDRVVSARPHEGEWAGASRMDAWAGATSWAMERSALLARVEAAEALAERMRSAASLWKHEHEHLEIAASAIASHEAAGAHYAMNAVLEYKLRCEGLEREGRAEREARQAISEELASARHAYNRERAELHARLGEAEAAAEAFMGLGALLARDGGGEEAAEVLTEAVHSLDCLANGLTAAFQELFSQGSALRREWAEVQSREAEAECEREALRRECERERSEIATERTELSQLSAQRADVASREARVHDAVSRLALERRQWEQQKERETRQREEEVAQQAASWDETLGRREAAWQEQAAAREAAQQAVWQEQAAAREAAQQALWQEQAAAREAAQQAAWQEQAAAREAAQQAAWQEQAAAREAAWQQELALRCGRWEAERMAAEGHGHLRMREREVESIEVIAAKEKAAEREVASRLQAAEREVASRLQAAECEVASRLQAAEREVASRLRAAHEKIETAKLREAVAAAREAEMREAEIALATRELATAAAEEAAAAKEEAAAAKEELAATKEKAASAKAAAAADREATACARESAAAAAQRQAAAAEEVAQAAAAAAKASTAITISYEARASSAALAAAAERVATAEGAAAARVAAVEAMAEARVAAAEEAVTEARAAARAASEEAAASKLKEQAAWQEAQNEKIELDEMQRAMIEEAVGGTSLVNEVRSLERALADERDVRRREFGRARDEVKEVQAAAQQAHSLCEAFDAQLRSMAIELTERDVTMCVVLTELRAEDLNCHRHALMQPHRPREGASSSAVPAPTPGRSHRKSPKPERSTSGGTQGAFTYDETGRPQRINGGGGGDGGGGGGGGSGGGGGGGGQCQAHRHRAADGGD